MGFSERLHLNGGRQVRFPFFMLASLNVCFCYDDYMCSLFTLFISSFIAGVGDEAHGEARVREGMYYYRNGIECAECALHKQTETEN